MKSNRAVLRRTRIASRLLALSACVAGMIFSPLAESATPQPAGEPPGINLPLQGPPSQPNACPDMVVTITELSMVSAKPAPQHTVKIGWSVSRPQCFNIEGFRVQGVVTFANGQKKTFETTLIGNANSLQTDVAGVPGQAARRVGVRVLATAHRQAIGGNSLNEPPPPLLVTNCTQMIPITVTQAALDGLQPAPNRPGQDFFPKIKAAWQTPNLPACVAPASFTVKITMKVKGKLNEKTVTATGTQRSVVVTFDSIAVGSGFAPDSVSAVVTTTGKSTITGSAQKETDVN